MYKDTKVLEYMEKIKEARFGDLENERLLSRELLDYSLEHRHVYGIGFAYTYLLDYYIQSHDSDNCTDMIRKAMEYTMDYGLDDLLMLVYNSCGIYYSYIHDDIPAFEHFIKSLELAEKLDDTIMKYRLYNNIAVSFHNKKDYPSAIPYYKQAYDILKNKELTGSFILYQFYLLENLINCSIAMDDEGTVGEYCRQMEDYIEEWPAAAKDPSLPFQQAIILAYYKRKGEAVAILREVLAWEGSDPLDTSDIIELYPHVLELLLSRREKELSWKVLKSLTACMEKESPKEKQEIFALTIRYYQTFGMEEELQGAYADYYLASQEALVSIARNQIDAMKEKLASFEVQRKLIAFQKLSYTDELCQIYNRRYYEELMAKYLEDENTENLGLIILDIDYFKDYNDLYGHKKGDEVLERVAECLKEEAPEKLTPCRYGGDEFCCVCRNMEEGEMIEYLTNVRKRLSRLNMVHSASGNAKIVTLSCGYSVRKSGYVGAKDLFDEADKALYWAKANGRDQFLGYSDRN